MLILADNDVGGAVAALRRIFESVEWATFSAMLDLRFIEFTDVGLARDASDPLVWHTCQEVGAVLITGNRASGDASLEHMIREHAGADSLPVVTIGDPPAGDPGSSVCPGVCDQFRRNLCPSRPPRGRTG
jgi:hypothetical protein